MLVRFCVAWVCFWFWCFVVGRHLAFSLTYSPTSGDSLSRTKRFYDRLSLERARHGPQKKINCFLAGRSDACGVWVCVCVWNYRRFTSLDLTAFGGMTFDRTFLLLRGVS